jgi:hypothetical protein
MPTLRNKRLSVLTAKGLLLADFVAEVGFTVSEDGVSVFTDEVSRRF